MYTDPKCTVWLFVTKWTYVTSVQKKNVTLPHPVTLPQVTHLPDFSWQMSGGVTECVSFGLFRNTVSEVYPYCV